jgi:hypothetical protein
LMSSNATPCTPIASTLDAIFWRRGGSALRDGDAVYLRNQTLEHLPGSPQVFGSGGFALSRGTMMAPGRKRDGAGLRVYGVLPRNAKGLTLRV